MKVCYFHLNDFIENEEVSLM